MSSRGQPASSNVTDPGLWDRRGVLAGAIAGSLSVLVAEPLPAATRAPSLIVADTRFAASREFAAEALRRGDSITWIKGDITTLWYEELDHRWRDEKTPVAGLTEFGAFFCLERLAMDRGLRVAFKGEHRRDGPQILHVLTGPGDVVTERTTLSDRNWPPEIAHLSMASRVSGPVTSRLHRTTSLRGEQPSLLVSWMITPKRLRGESA
jgi:hypothetical protein